MKKIMSVILAVFICGFAFSACNSHTPLLSNLGTSLSDITELILTDKDGKEVTVTDSADIARFDSYTKSEKLPEDRETEIFDETNYTLCTVKTKTNQEIAFYIWNSGEIICSLGEELKSEFYIFTTQGEKADSDYVKEMFYKYE